MSTFFKKYKTYIIQVAIALIIGGLSSLATKDNFNLFDTIQKPPLVPPAFVFPIVWGILFVLMGIGAALCYETVGYIPFVYWLQLCVNFLWSIIFFNMQTFLFAFIWLLLLLALIIIMFIEFYQINKKAAYLQIPYILWVSFAGYLTFMIWLFNK